MSESIDRKIHQGRNVKRFREMLGLKQEAFAAELGEDWTQRRVSLLEGKEEIEPEILEQVSKVLKVPVDAIKNFDEEAALTFIGNTFNNHDNSATVNGYIVNYTPSFNPLDKMVELYERMLREKDELIEELKKLRQ